MMALDYREKWTMPITPQHQAMDGEPWPSRQHGSVLWQDR